MKPERIQFAAMGGPIRGFFQTFWFDSYGKAETFSDFVTDMADNHGREVSCSIDPDVNEVTLLAQAEGIADLDGAQSFVDKVSGIYDEWSAPPTVS